MTLEEKAGLCSGADFWHLKGVERLGIPGVMVSDGPHGLRKQDQEADHLGINDSIKAVCFPAACATAASFDEALLERMGRALGEECGAGARCAELGCGHEREALCCQQPGIPAHDVLVRHERADAAGNLPCAV